MAKKKAKKAKAAPKKKVVAKKSAKKAAAKKPAPVKAAPKKNLPEPPKKPVIVSPKNSSSRQYTQSELFECIRGSCGFNTRTDAKDFYSGFVGLIQSALKSGYKVVLPGLGKIQVRKTKARMGRNPMTQEPISIPARRKVAFTPLKALKEAVL